MNNRNRYFRFTRMAALGLAVSNAMTAFAAPTGGAVSAGSASIVATPGTTTITQSSQNAAINWQSFGIGAAEAVRFVQPNSSSVALNRVLGADPSNILGSLSANGKVFLVNPNGILFAPGAQVNVGGLVASTRNISDADFMAGRYKFDGAGNGSVVNRGTINASDGGYVALLGANVSNEGIITARLGSVVLASGNAMTLDVAGDGLLNLAVNEGAVNALAQNSGMIRADGGTVLLTAKSAESLLQSAVNNTGVIQAQTIDTRNGTIRLVGDMQNGTVSAGGTLDASGLGAGQTGGNITLAGHHVGLFGAQVNASGDAGGGTVLVGGGYQGNNAAVPNASATYMSADAKITADAISRGNGGTVVLWSNDSTRASGSISAKGGALGGDGGLIETSGHALEVNGISINASAANGKAGTWLLDPADVIIGAGTTNATLIGNVFTPNSGVSAATVDVGALRVALEAGGGTNITVTTTNVGAAGNGAGDISVNSALTWTPTNPTTLSLLAARDVNINAPITTTRGNLVVCCGRDVNVNAPITTTNGSVLLSGGRNVNVIRNGLTVNSQTAGIVTTDGNIQMCSANDIVLSNTFDAGPLITLTRGSVTVGESLSNFGVPRGLTLNAGNGGTGPGAAAGTVTFTGGTFITATGPAGVTPINIFYNPTSYLTPTDYSGRFTGNAGPVVSRMLVFPDGADKAFDGTTTAVFTALKGTPAGVSLVAGPGAAAAFDTPGVGVAKTVTFTGFTLAGANAAAFALPATCCAPIVGRTTASITPAVVVLPVIVAPVVVAPVVVAPDVVAPVAGEAAVAASEVLPVLFVPGMMIGATPFLSHSPAFNLTVAGVNVPAPLVLEIVQPPVQLAPQPVPVPVVVPPPPYVPPYVPPRRDRN